MPTPKPRTTIYLEPELYKSLELRAKEERRSLSNLCNLLIEVAMQIWLNENPQPEPEPEPEPTAKPAVAKAKSAAAKTKRRKV